MPAQVKANNFMYFNTLADPVNSKTYKALLSILIRNLRIDLKTAKKKKKNYQYFVIFVTLQLT